MKQSTTYEIMYSNVLHKWLIMHVVSFMNTQVYLAPNPHHMTRAHQIIIITIGNVSIAPTWNQLLALDPHQRTRVHQNWIKVCTPWCMTLDNMHYHQKDHHTHLINYTPLHSSYATINHHEIVIIYAQLIITTCSVTFKTLSSFIHYLITSIKYV